MDDENENNEHRLLIHDIDYHLETHGLRQNYDGATSEQNMYEARRRVEEESAHQQRIIEEAFGELDEKANDETKQQVLNSLEGKVLTLHVKGGATIETSMAAMAAACDTVYTLATSPEFLVGSSEGYELSLDAYEFGSVQDFVDMVHKDKSTDDVCPDHVVECCEIANFLQCRPIMDAMVSILMQSVDTANCLSIMQFADRYQLNSLFERSLSEALASIGKIDEHDVWQDLSLDLRERLRRIKTAIETRIFGNNSGTKLYFSDISEYLAIFAEVVQYNRERLDEAKLRQGQSRSDRGWRYTQRFIEKQERKVERLEAVMAEQKKLLAEERNQTWKQRIQHIHTTRE